MRAFAHAVEFALFSLLRGVLALLPFGASQRIGKAIGAFFCRVLSGRRAIAMENLRNAFPDLSEAELLRVAKGSFENFGIAMCEFLNFGKLGTGELQRLLNYDVNRAAFRTIGESPGFVLITGHFGNWELAAFGVPPLANKSVLVVVRSQSNRRVDAAINRFRCLSGNTVVPMEHAVREGLRRLHDGGIVGLAGDQSATRESDYVPFFGREVATFRGPAAFALRTRVPILFLYVVRRPDYTYDFHVEEVPTSDLSGATEENVRELTRRHTAALERIIRLHPEHWLWTHRRWKHLASSPAPGKGAAAVA